MRYFILLIPVVFFSVVLSAQQPKTYYYSNTSEYYLTDQEVDSVVDQVSAAIFSENHIPETLFEKKYPVIKDLLIAVSRTDISRSFKNIEGKLPRKRETDKKTESFLTTKKLYKEALEKALRSTYRNNTALSMYLSFKTNDRITGFHSTVRVLPNGKLLVQEQISIYNGSGRINPVYGNEPELEESGAMNDEIKRGIVRSFPLYYVNKYKLFQNTTFELKSVLRDGKKENYHTEDHENGILVYTGSRDIYLNDGYYTYTLTYETDHQLKLLQDFDELYWNVTGNGWSFRIDSASCTIIIPKGSSLLSSKCYTGAQGETAEDCRFTSRTEGDSTYIFFKTNKPLLPYHGFTVASSWSKGFVTSSQSLSYYIWNNKGVFFLPIAAIFSAIFCFIYWRRYGRDPEKGTIYPQFEPPGGYSPAAIGYIYSQEFTRQLTAATIVDAAVRNNIHIEVKREGVLFKHNEYIISRGKKTSTPPMTGYRDFYSEVKGLLGTSIRKGKYNSSLGSLNKAVQSHCETTYKNKDGWKRKSGNGFFSLNRSFTTIPILICIVAAGWGFFGGIIRAMMLSNFWQIGYFIAGIILCVIVLKLFSRLLPAYSPEGRKLADKIEGFRMFLATADEKRFDAMNPPAKSLELYEKYLPFAIALGCEITWGERFEEIISTAAIAGTVAASSFSHSISNDSQSFSSSFASSFSGAISSASTPPSSSSSGGSSSGGGSSGGGGGGGGGGGW